MEAFNVAAQCYLFIIRDKEYYTFFKPESSAKVRKFEAFVLLPALIKQSYPKVCQYFTENGVKVLTNLEVSVLSVALQLDQVEVVEIILNKGQHSKLLPVAVEVGNVGLVNMILRKNFAVSKMKFCPSRIHSAIDESNLKVIETLLATKADISYRNPRGGTLFHLAVSRNDNVLIEVLLKHGADVNLTRSDGSTPFHLAVLNGSVRIITLLVKNCTNVDAFKCNGSTCLYLAAARKHEKIFGVLLRSGASLPTKTHERLRLLCLAMQNSCDDIVDKILSAGHNSAQRHTDETDTDINSTLLLMAVEKQFLTVTKRLLESGVDVNTQSPDGRTVLQLAVNQKNPEIVGTILNHSPDLRKTKNKNALREAVYGEGEEFDKIVRMLLHHGLTLDPEDESDMELLHNAVRKNYLTLVKQLLEYGTNVNETYDNFDANSNKEEVMPLIIAIRCGNEEMIKLLLDNRADVNEMCDDFTIPIFEAVQKSSASVVKILLDYGASVKDHPEVLHSAVRRSVREIVEVLLQHGVSPNEKDREGAVPIIIAVKQNDLKIIDLLLKYGADINCTDENGRTPLYTASHQGAIRVVEYLVRNHADMEKGHRLNSKPVGVASKESIVDMMLKMGANYDYRDLLGDSPLSFAALMGCSRLFQTYLDHGFTNEELLSKTEICQRFGLHASGLFHEVEKSTYKKFAVKLARHMVKMEVAGLCYDTENQMPQWHCKEMGGENFRIDCETEMARIKAQNVNGTEGTISIYDILTGNLCNLISYARNDNVAMMLHTKDFIKSFPIYASIISCQLRKGSFQLKLLEAGVRTFHSVTKKFIKLPFEIVEKILGYLSNQDIIVFMNAVTPMVL